MCQSSLVSYVFLGVKEIHLLVVTNGEEGEGEVNLVLASTRFGPKHVRDGRPRRRRRRRRRVGLGERPEVERVETTEASEGEDHGS